MIRDSFDDRHCFTMIRPVVEEKKLSNITSSSDLRGEFLSQVDTFKKKIFNDLKPKSFNGNLLTGRSTYHNIPMRLFLTQYYY
jgi:hypothetical protein